MIHFSDLYFGIARAFGVCFIESNANEIYLTFTQSNPCVSYKDDISDTQSHSQFPPNSFHHLFEITFRIQHSIKHCPPHVLFWIYFFHSFDF